jgi:poly(hydroxyalkanoate) granule-associated protein
MVKKLKNLAKNQAAGGGAKGLGQLLDSQLAGTVKDSAQQIWLAGLGAFSKAQEEGNKVFEALVKEGLSIQRKTTAVAEEKIGEVTQRMSGLAGDVGNRAGAHWDKLESIFEDRVARALNRLGVPSAKDVDALIARIDALSAAVSGIDGAKPAARKATAKPAAKAAPARKAAAKAPAAPARRATRKPA